MINKIMEYIWRAELEEILSVGHSLYPEMGILNWALPRPQALEAAEKLRGLGMPILGDDVCENIDGRIHPNCDNWYSNPKTLIIRKEKLIISKTVLMSKGEAWQNFSYR